MASPLHFVEMHIDIGAPAAQLVDACIPSWKAKNKAGKKKTNKKTKQISGLSLLYFSSRGKNMHTFNYPKLSEFIN